MNTLEIAPEAEAILSNLKVVELRAIAKAVHNAANDVKISGYSKMPKAELIRQLSFADAWYFAEMRINRMDTVTDEAADAEAGELLDAVLGEHSYHNPNTDGRPAAFDVTASFAGLGDAVKKATDALSGLVKATTGSVAITKYSGHEAIATAVFGTDSIAGHVTRQRGRWVLRDGVRTIRAKTLGKIAKQWAKRLSFHATTIDVETMR